MVTRSEHTFYIPVMGLAYTVDSPVKVARYGISSVVSIIQDHLLEQMRKFYIEKMGRHYRAIDAGEEDHRAKRITAYLNLLQDIVDHQMESLTGEELDSGGDLDRYFNLLPDDSSTKALYHETIMAKGAGRQEKEKRLRDLVVPGTIDVNIMTKLDKLNVSSKGEVLPAEYADAMSALRGFALSRLSSSIVFSAGLNPRLFTYMEHFDDFFPDRDGNIKKKVILKVSDFRSAMIQGKFLAKKGIWVSEFRIESGLNCGGHAFPTEGKLMGPILEEFKVEREKLNEELFQLCNSALKEKGRSALSEECLVRITYQGGIGSAGEDRFLREHYGLDGTGWGSPFLLVPEATNVDEETLESLVRARQEDYFMSYASPLGIPFNNFRNSSSERQRKERIAKGRPGSPCYLKFLAFNDDFKLDRPICVSSRQYQRLKLKDLENSELGPQEAELERERILEKDCLCEGLTASVHLKNKIPIKHSLKAVTICPGPNLAFFSKLLSLDEMVGHIYGRNNAMSNERRPLVFVNEMKMYRDYMVEEFRRNTTHIGDKQVAYFQRFRTNLLKGLEYYGDIARELLQTGLTSFEQWQLELDSMYRSILEVCEKDPYKAIFLENT